MTLPALHRFARAVVTIAPPQPIGIVDGLMLVMIPITGGRLDGELQADILPGADWLRTGSDGLIIVDARYALRTDDGTIIQVRNRGSAAASVPGEPMWATPRFTAPAGPHDWLNYGAHASAISGNPGDGSIIVEYFRIG
jgi:hypothetical protein